MRLIDAEVLDKAMYHKTFEVDDGRNVWNSGLWIRYKIWEEAREEAPTVEAIPISFLYEYMALCESVGAYQSKETIECLIDDWREEKGEKDDGID